MRKILLSGLMTGLATVAMFGLPKVARSQDAPKNPPPPAAEKPVRPVYRLEFTVREVEDGKRLNSRSYLMSVRDDETSMIRVGNRIPYNTGKEQFQVDRLTVYPSAGLPHFDVGINIDCHLREQGNIVVLENTSVEISSVVKDESTAPGTLNPVVREARARVTVAVTPGKPTMVTALDDVSSNRRYEVEVTATKVK